MSFWRKAGQQYFGIYIIRVNQIYYSHWNIDSWCPTTSSFHNFAKRSMVEMLAHYFNIWYAENMKPLNSQRCAKHLNAVLRKWVRKCLSQCHKKTLSICGSREMMCSNAFKSLKSAHNAMCAKWSILICNLCMMLFDIIIKLVFISDATRERKTDNSVDSCNIKMRSLTFHAAGLLHPSSFTLLLRVLRVKAWQWQNSSSCLDFIAHC